LIDLDRVRRDTPACSTLVHVNNAGASLMPRQVVEVVTRYLALEARIGGYEAAERQAAALDAVYASAARLLGCHPDEIALFENATRAFNAVLYALPFAEGDRILTSRAEYCSNYMAYLHLSQTSGAEIVVVPDDEHGQLDLDALTGLVEDRVKLIAITHVATSGGLVNPAAGVGRVARAAGVPYLLDACQSVGQMPVDVEEIGCDFLATTGRKWLRGPRGTGLAYVRRDHVQKLHPPTLDLGGAAWVERDRYELRADARRFETWEASHALRLGLGRAIDYALDLGLDAIWDRVRHLAGMLREGLGQVPGVVQHDLGSTRCGIVSFSLGHVGADEVKASLRAEGVNVELSFVEDTRLDLEGRGLTSFVRASPHYYNTEDEITRVCQLLADLARRSDGRPA
jgi:selenocysteine lyase/cysteine desulfurase